MSSTLTRPIHGFHLALSPEALAQAKVIPSFVIKQGSTIINPDANDQYKLSVTIDDRLVFSIEATGYLADANDVPSWVPASWNLPGTGNYVLIGQSEGFTSAQTAQTFWAHGGNQGLSNIPQYEVPILDGGIFTIPRTEPTPLLSFDVQIYFDDNGNPYLKGVDENNEPDDSEIPQHTVDTPKPYWEVYTTAAFGQRNPLQEIAKQIVIS